MTSQPLKTILWVSASHWDREWYRPFEGFRGRLVEMVDRAIDCVTNVDGYGFFFLDGQSIILEDYLAVRPEMETRLRQLIAEGRIGAGPFYVLQDEMVEEGELLVRNLQRGIALAKRFGAKEFVGYSPDAFGHCAQLPQLLKLAGVNTTVFGRGHDGSQQENVWSSPDGSEVFLVWLPFGYGGFAHHDCLADGRHIPEDRDEALAMFEQRFERLRPFVKSGIALAMDGGDHLSPDANAVRLAHDYNERHPDGPRFELVSLIEAVRRISQHPEPSHFKGELRTTRTESTGWIVPGTCSTRMPLKIGLSTLTRQLLSLETLCTTLPYSSVAHTQIERAWQLLLQNIPHDSISGCHADEVYLENVTRLNSVRGILSHVTEQTLGAYCPRSARTGRTPRAVFYDPNPGMTHFKPFTLECPFPCISDPSRVNVSANGASFVVSEVEPYQTIHSHLTTYRIRGFYKNTSGHNVFDAGILEDCQRQASSESTSNAPLLTFVDGGDAGDTYNYSPPEQDSIHCSQGQLLSATRRKLTDTLLQTKAEVAFPVPASLSGDRKSRSNEKVDLRIRYETVSDLESGITWIRGTVHNAARDHRLRIVIPTPAQDTHSYAGAAFHIERRPVKLKFDPEQFSERPLTDYPFVDYIRYGGLSIYSDSNGEYQITPRGIEITLCRCVGWLGRPDLSYRKGQAGPFFETPLAQLSESDIDFAFIVAPTLPDNTEDFRRKSLLWNTSTLCTLSDDVQPVRAKLPITIRNVELSSLHWTSEQEIELRLFNPRPEQAAVRLTVNVPYTELFEIDLKHQRVTGGISCRGTAETSFIMRPFQVLTLQLLRLR